MRLIDTGTLRLHEFIEGASPPYAILSHRWADGEVTLQEYESIRHGSGLNATSSKRRRSGFNNQIKCKSGYQKIVSFCRLAREDGLEFGWVDTCCIDKKSSAELSEAINSMYKWYRRAERCYVYLSDVEYDTYLDLIDEDEKGWNNFQRSQWFTRGWTLQELIAPKIVSFYDVDWRPLDTRIELADYITRATGIDVDVLTGRMSPQSYSVACRMFWASNRSTTREEDMAYCLMGIFNINMPMLYGEGNKAFIRLQEEILRATNDHSIFAWSDVEPSQGGLLATTPAFFKNSENYVPYTGLRPDEQLVTLTSSGISIKVPIIEKFRSTKAVLNCVNQRCSALRPCIRLACGDRQGSQFARIDRHYLDETEEDASRQQIYIKQNVDVSSYGNTEAVKPQIIRIVMQESDKILQESYERRNGPPHYRYWVSPQSYICNSPAIERPHLMYPGDDSARTTRTEWTEWDAIGFDLCEVNKSLAETMFSLPLFPNTPAVMVQASWGSLMFGRDDVDSVGVQEAPLELCEGILDVKHTVREKFESKVSIDFKTFWSENRSTKVREYLTLSDGTQARVKVTLVEHEAVDEFIVEVLWVPTQIFKSNGKIYRTRFDAYGRPCAECEGHTVIRSGAEEDSEEVAIVADKYIELVLPTEPLERKKAIEDITAHGGVRLIDRDL